MEQIEQSQKICPVCGYPRDIRGEAEFCLSPGTVVGGHYQVGKVIGMGGFGITYLGWDQKLDRKVAVKEYFPAEFATRGEKENKLTVYPGDTKRLYYRGLEAFIREAKRLATLLGIPQVVQVYDCLLENETGYLVMEYLVGKTVKERLREEKKIPVSEAIQVAAEVLDALDQIHREGILHRDIAPDNIFLSEDGKTRLLDFGSARPMVPLDRSLSVMVKPGYAPEEQYQSHGEQGPWSDVYGVGATLYRMVTGERPKPAVDRLLGEDLLPPNKKGIRMGRKAERALIKALNVKAKDRYQTAKEFREALLQAETKKSPFGKGAWILTVLAVLLAAVRYLI